jgi:RNA polymerase sigma-70 factor (ECF subfamily)
MQHSALRRGATGTMTGEPTTAEQAYSAHRTQIFRFLLRKTGDPDQAEELTQRVFTDAVAAFARPETTPKSSGAWLHAVAERRFVDEVRHRRKSRHAEELAARSDAVDPQTEPGPAAAEAFYSAVRALPSSTRQIVLLRLVEGQSYAEIGAGLSLSEAACKMRFARALRRVRASLEGAGITP